MTNNSTENATDWKAGLARRVITPDEPMFMAGFAARDHASEGVLHDLWTKAVALEDKDGNRVVLICTDIIGLPGALCDEVGARVDKQWGVPRSHLFFNASHTHSGPMLADVIDVMMSELPEEEHPRIQNYTRKLADILTAVIGEALKDLQQADVAFGRGITTFAVNRRQPTPNGVTNGYNPAGPSDFEVPVLQISAPDGTIRAILGGYACHTTSLGIYQFSGDWAGFAQLELEQKFPGAQAMFMMLCGADQNPLPRSGIERSELFGAQMTTAVVRALSEPLQPLRGPLQVSYESISLKLQPHTRDVFEACLNDSASDKWKKNHAKLMLQHYDEGKPIQEIGYPVQAISFGDDCVLLALSGEVVIDYCLRAKRELGIKNLIVAGYSNGIAAYIPSKRVLLEGGYEAGESRYYFGLPTPFADDVEERIFSAIDRAIGSFAR